MLETKPYLFPVGTNYVGLDGFRRVCAILKENGTVEFFEGSQHKYPQCRLVFDTSTRNCFSFCSQYCRHAQVRGDEVMFLQKDVAQLHRNLKQHHEVSDLLITGGEKCFALQITEGRNMEWMNRVFQAKYAEQKNKIDLLLPFDTGKYFFSDELRQIEAKLVETLRKRLA